MRFEICLVWVATSLPALKTVHSTSSLYGGIAHAALKTFSISTRHWFPMKEFDSAIFSFPFFSPDESAFDVPELHADVASSTIVPAAASSRAYRCRIIALHLRV
ncbi:hypothetical protein [Virgisporangium aurantiacum]|uniref:hypothetical protein n=1 Tax=Virgisporangium aurantiacum TaxID=175570 RepID=UPI001EF22F40|nr:hypothetical protein [Virgisporangium aurantiacum]